jgi:hypothetical protein
MSRSTQQTHEWWKESIDSNQRRMRLSSLRDQHRTQYAAAWRRNLTRLGVLIAIPVVIRLVSTW